MKQGSTYGVLPMDMTVKAYRATEMEVTDTWTWLGSVEIERDGDGPETGRVLASTPTPILAGANRMAEDTAFGKHGHRNDLLDSAYLGPICQSDVLTTLFVKTTMASQDSCTRPSSMCARSFQW